jgi:hypothetical protein
MTGLPTSIPRTAIEAVLRVPKPAPSLGEAAILYLALLGLAMPRGIVIRTRMRLAEMLSVSEVEIDRWLVRLAKLGLVVLKTPSPYFVISLSFWSGYEEGRAQNPEQSGRASGEMQRDVPVSGKQAAAAAVKNKINGDGVQGEGAGLLAEAQKILGGNDAEELAELLAQYPQAIVRRALARVRATPARRIRKSKLALFRYLLTTFSENAHGQSSNHHPQV